MKTIDELLREHYEPASAPKSSQRIEISSLAVVVVDMQNYLLGVYGKHTEHLPHVKEMHGYQEEVLRLAVERKIPVFLLEYEGMGETTKQILDALKGKPDLTISKKYTDGFKETTLEEKLRERQITGIIVAGVNATGCVLHTAESAVEKGFNVFTSPQLITNASGYFERGWDAWYRKECTYFDNHKKLLEALRQ